MLGGNFRQGLIQRCQPVTEGNSPSGAHNTIQLSFAQDRLWSISAVHKTWAGESHPKSSHWSSKLVTLRQTGNLHYIQRRITKKATERSNRWGKNSKTWRQSARISQRMVDSPISAKKVKHSWVCSAIH